MEKNGSITLRDREIKRDKERERSITVIEDKKCVETFRPEWFAQTTAQWQVVDAVAVVLALTVGAHC